MNLLYTILHNLAYSVCILAVIIACFFLLGYKKSDKMMRKLAIYFLVSCMVECGSTVVGTAYHQNNLYFFHFFAAFEIFILAHFFFDFYEKLLVKIQRNWFVYLLLILVVGNSIFLQPIDTFNSYALTLVSVAIIGMSMYSFYLMLDKDNFFPYQKELKWLIISFFLLHCSTLMILLFSNKILEFSQDVQIIIWITRSTLILIIKLVQCYQSYKIYLKIKELGGVKTPDSLTTLYE
jgi:hypothetical protein